MRTLLKRDGARFSGDREVWSDGCSGNDGEWNSEVTRDGAANRMDVDGVVPCRDGAWNRERHNGAVAGCTNWVK